MQPDLSEAAVFGRPFQQVKLPHRVEAQAHWAHQTRAALNPAVDQSPAAVEVQQLPR
jgi:hypothetical protein